MLSPRTQATVLLTVKFPGDLASTNPLTPSEWGRFAEWLRARSLLPESLLTDQLHPLLAEFHDKSITPDRLNSLLERGTALGLLTEKWSRAGLWVMTRADPDYPSRLKKRLGAGSPAVLFGSGNRALLDKGGLAVVGSRQATPEDLQYSRQLGVLAAHNGYSVVSGGARGVDAAAMLGALETEGTAVGILANDLLRASTSPDYRDHLRQNNLVLASSTNPEARFDVGTAMQRNKYIYCLADAAVVVHSGAKGGTWSGAQENLKKKWVPLWVKETVDPEAGNQALLAHSESKCLPQDIAQLNILSLFAPETESLDVTGNPAGLPPAGESPPPALAEGTTYELFLDRLHQLCKDGPRTSADLQQALGLHKKQLTDWLKKAIDDGDIVKKTNPVRYDLKRQDSLL